MFKKGEQLKNTALLVFFLVSKVFEKLINKRIVDQLEKCGLFYDFQYGFNGFRSPCSTRDLLTVVFNKIGRATQAVALYISKAFGRVWHAGLLHKCKSYGIPGQIFGLIPSYLRSRCLQVVLDGKSSQEYLINAGVPQSFILGPAPFLLYFNELMMLSVILLAMLMVLLPAVSVIRHLICDNN